MSRSQNNSAARTTRRRFLQTAALGAGRLMSGVAFGQAKAQRPNFLFIISDQLGLDAIAAHGCPDVHTPNMDRFVQRGVTFMESHSTNPVCSPARSSLFTGRMPTETGVITNSRPIHPTRPNMGQWLGKEGYEAVYCGKWHLPGGYPAEIEGFTVLPTGGGQGDLVDSTVSASCEAYLKGRGRGKSFVLAASLLQPHDICYWAIQAKTLVPDGLAFPQVADKLPKLPPNHRVRPRAPRKLDQLHYDGFSDEQWRYYLYIYCRQVEMVDGDIGRILNALEDSGQADNTVVILTSDHGDGRGRHQHVSKWYPYDEAVKVPMIVSCPGRMAEGLRDAEHLVSGLDVMNTMCDYAGIQPPPDSPGRSLRPLLEKKPTEWREFVVSEHHVIGRMLRTPQYKYVRYEGDPVEQLFDMKADPWETKNLYDQAKYASVVKDHRKLLDDWEARLKKVEPTEDMSKLGGKGAKQR
ncbi:MAG: sulfatase-like hydrolase/transferase [Planctomycetota bacterium]